MTPQWLDITTEDDRLLDEQYVAYAEAETGRIIAKLHQWNKGGPWCVEMAGHTEEFILREQAEKFVEDCARGKDKP
jgi:hypothetical protein